MTTRLMCRNVGWLFFGMVLALPAFSQNPATSPVPTDTAAARRGVPEDIRRPEDTVLRIRNLNPYFTLHVDSTLQYGLEINKNPANYFWYLKNSPLGLKINKDNGMLTFRADKSYFLSGKLKYDYQYKVNIGVQNLNDPKEKIDTSFTIVFFTTDITPSRVKPTVNTNLFIEEGDTVSFKIECEDGSFPIQSITFFSNVSIKNYTLPKKCDDDFIWSPSFDFIKDNDSSKLKIVLLYFVGVNKFFTKDTAVVKVYVKDALNYPVMLQEYARTQKDVKTYILQLKYSFMQLDKKVKGNKGTRTTFDMTTSASALGGTVFSSSTSATSQNTGKILPSAGVALVPVKEAVAPTKTAEQNAASLVRSSIKRLEYQVRENALSGEKDNDIVKKINKLKEEMKQIQIQLIDVPIDDNSNLTEEQLNEYFNSKRVMRKYKLQRNK